MHLHHLGKLEELLYNWIISELLCTPKIMYNTVLFSECERKKMHEWKHN